MSLEASVEKSLREYAQKYRTHITLSEGAEIARRSIKTIYNWSSQGLFDGFKHKRGRLVLLTRDDFILFLFPVAPATRAPVSVRSNSAVEE